MTVRRSQGTGMFYSDKVAGNFYTAEEARAAEEAGSYTNETGLDANELSDTFGNQSAFLQFSDDIAAPEMTEAPRVTRQQWERENRRVQPTTLFDRNAPENQPGGMTTGKIGGATGAYNAVSDRGRAAFDYYRDIRDPTNVRDFISAKGEDVGVSHAGDAIDPASANIYWSPEAMISDTVTRTARNLGTTADGLGGQPMTQQGQMSGDGSNALSDAAASAGPDGDVGDREDQAERRTNEAGQQFQDEFAENEAENDEAWGNAWDAIDDIQGGDYGMSDEARAFQKEGLQMQRDLLERTLGFDPNAYATQFQDQALARNIALARAGGTAAAQQANIFAAMEGAPALYAEGARQAAQLENQRLSSAAGITEAFGNLGTMTRNSDEARAQFESSLSVEIADQVGRLTQGQVSLNQQESQMFAEIWTNFAELQSRYAGMDSDEQLAWWQREMTERGQDLQFQAILKELEAQGKVTSKDIIGGLFQLGGGVIGAGGQIMAARAAGESRRGN